MYDCNEKYKKEHNEQDCIEEIRIEGHTSSEWKGEVSDNAFVKNMELSQDRSREILTFALGLNDLDEKQRKFIRDKMTANGLSSAHLKYKKDSAGNEIKDSEGNKIEDKEASRRIEIKIAFNDKEIVENINKVMNDGAK